MARRKLGSERAAWRSATTNALAPSDAMSQADVASCIDIETLAASHRMRSKRYGRDCHGDARRAVGTAAAAGPGDSRATLVPSSLVAACFTWPGLVFASLTQRGTVESPAGYAEWPSDGLFSAGGRGPRMTCSARPGSRAEVLMAHRPIRLLPLLGVVLALLAPPAPGQGDPLVLQQQAIRRIDGVVESFRKTGEIRSPELAQAERELAASNQALAARGDWSALALGLIKQGHTQRMQGNWASAIALYGQAAEAARRGGNVVHHADALAWRALAEHSRRNLGQAFSDANQAVRLAETAGDKDVLARALDVLATVQASQGDLAGAADTLNREVAIAVQAKDPMAPYFAYLNRSDVYLQIGVKCDFQRDFAPCYQALDRARTDLEQALAITRSQGLPALARQTEQFLANLETRRQLIKSQESAHQSIQKAGIFRPGKAGDVLVTERFVAEPGPVPPVVAQFYQEAKRVERQAGGFADVALARNQYIEGLMNEMRGNNDAALAHYLKAVGTLEQ